MVARSSQTLGRSIRLNARFEHADSIVQDLRTYTISGFAQLRNEMNAGFTQLRDEWNTRFDRMFGVLVGLVIGIGALLIGVAGLWLKA